MSLDIVAQLWTAGESFAGIGSKLAVSRSIVAGRIDRARKAGDPRFAPRPKPVVAPIEPIVAPVKKPRAPVPFPALKPNRCRWPVNAPARGGVFLMCGELVAKSRAN